MRQSSQKSYLSASEEKIDRWMDGVILAVEADISTRCDVFVSQEEDIIDFDITLQKKKYLVPFAQLLLITLQIESLKAETWELHGCIMIHMFWCNVGHADWRALRPPAQTSAWTISVIPRSNVWSCEGILGYRM